MSRNRNSNNPFQGHPLTMQRQLLLKLLRQAGGHIDAKELYRRASAKDEAISPATVYRTLKLFKELGLIDEMRLNKFRCYYEVRSSSEHQHLVCHGCGKVIEFDNPLVGKLIESVRHQQNFNVTKAELYLEGYCPDCEDKAKR